ncbi:hypothetical protein [Nostoc cycadae]|uniref:hypothetical protein n=1 Tax=Nostoc cycadae TaxID=246795 RepID=UPI0011AEF3CC|nr:hypothetical protein [Nostoc cycadae]
MTNDQYLPTLNGQNLQTMMKSFSFSLPLSTFNLPENPLPNTVPLSPVSLPSTNSPWYAAPVIVMPSTSQFRF